MADMPIIAKPAQIKRRIGIQPCRRLVCKNDALGLGNKLHPNGMITLDPLHVNAVVILVDRNKSAAVNIGQVHPDLALRVIDRL